MCRPSRGASMRRREFITLLGIVSASSLTARAQQSAMPVIGVLHGVSAAQWTDRMVGFHRGLNEAGFVEGRNVRVEYRWAEGQFDRLPAMAGDLVERKVAVICAGAGDVAIRAAMAATTTTPIVFTTASDPVRAGFVASLGRPGGNVTGATFMGVELVAKRLELLHEIFPGITRIALLVNPNNPRPHAGQHRVVEDCDATHWSRDDHAQSRERKRDRKRLTRRRAAEGQSTEHR